MADVTTTEQIIREAPDIEAYKLGLLQSAKGLSNTPLDLPAYQVASFSPDQLAAFDQARSGIGAYQPYLQQGASSMGQGANLTQQAQGLYSGADTRSQFPAAQSAIQQGLGAAGQMAGAAQKTTGAYDLLGQAGNITQQYQQADLAKSLQGMTAAEQAAGGSRAADLGQAYNALGAGMGQYAQGTGQYNPQSVSSFMDPYQREVIQNAMDEINRQGAMQQGQASARAVGQGAFGGTRASLERTELARNTEQLRNQTMANLLSQGYTQAQASAMTAYEQAKQRDLAAGQGMAQAGATYGQLGINQANLGQNYANQLAQMAATRGQLGIQQAGLGQAAAQQLGNLGAARGNLAATEAGIYGQQAGLMQQAGTGLGNLASQQSAIGQGIAQGIGSLGSQMSNIGVQQAALGQAAQQMGQSDVNMLYNIGQQQQAYNQATLDAQRNTALQQEMAPYQQLGFLSDIYKGAPSSQSSITASSAPTPSSLQTAAGLGIAGLAAASGAKKAGIF